jgi:hypothetical protein
MNALCWLLGHKYPVTTLIFVKLRSKCVRCGVAYWWQWSR